jgi:hypothetical protein
MVVASTPVLFAHSSLRVPHESWHEARWSRCQAGAPLFPSPYGRRAEVYAY